MAEELQSLLEKIQKDGVEKAEAASKQIIADARKKADEIIQTAEAEAKNILEKAEKDGSSFAERGKTSLQQAARDVVLTVRQAIDTTLKEITKAEISKSLSPSVLKDLIGRIVDAYVKSGSGAGMEVLLNEKDLKETTKLVMGSMKEKMKSGIEIKTDNKITGGFKVSLKDENVEHDFTDEAITESLCSLLRPHIAEIVKGQEKKQD